MERESAEPRELAQRVRPDVTITFTWQLTRPERRVWRRRHGLCDRLCGRRMAPFPHVMVTVVMAVPLSPCVASMTLTSLWAVYVGSRLGAAHGHLPQIDIDYIDHTHKQAVQQEHVEGGMSAPMVGMSAPVTGVSWV
eukprot:148879-Chlamydomonas_euryale.AAC.2